MVNGSSGRVITNKFKNNTTMPRLQRGMALHGEAFLTVKDGKGAKNLASMYFLAILRVLRVKIGHITGRLPKGITK